MPEAAIINRPARRTTKAAAPDVGPLEGVVIQGDLSRLSEPERLEYYNAVCRSLGLNPLTQPFGYIVFNKQLKLYALKNCTDQLRSLRGVSVTLTRSEQVGDFFFVDARAALPDGRTDEDRGVVSLKGLAGEALANAYMRAVTKAKRRVTLSVCGLGWLDETEVETIPDARPVLAPPATPVAHAVPDAQISALWKLCQAVATLTGDQPRKVADDVGLPAESWRTFLTLDMWQRATHVLTKQRADLEQRLGEVAQEEAAAAGEDAPGTGA